MSAYEEPDESLIEETRQQIQTLVSEIDQLSRQSLTPGEFYLQFLERVRAALAATGAVVWDIKEGGQLNLEAQVNLHETGLLESEDHQRRHGRLLARALQSPTLAAGQGMIVPPHAGFGDDQDAGNPTGCLLVIGALRTELEMVGLVEIFQRPETQPEVQQGFLNFLLKMCQMAGDFLKGHQLRKFSDRQVLWSKLEDFTRIVHASLEPLEAAYTIANESRRLIDCDRVSVALSKGRTCKIEAVSGQDIFDKRSNTVRLLGRLASAVVATGEPVWYTGETRDMAPQVEDAIQEYVDEAHTKMIAILPLGRPKPDQDVDEKDRERIEPPVGALIIEQIEDNRITPGLLQRVDVVCQHSSIALANAVEHHSMFLMPVWRAIGKSRVLVSARLLPKTLLAVFGVLAVILFLTFFPADFELHCKGTLEPVDRTEVFANTDGVVYELCNGPDGKPIEHGSRVTKGQTLVRLRNSELALQIVNIHGELNAARDHFNFVQRTLSSGGQLRAEDGSKLTGDLIEAKAKVESLERTAEELHKKEADLEVRSPIDGVVVTWDLRNRIFGRPVQRGNALLRIADPKGPWQLELHMADDRMGYIGRAEKEGEEKRTGPLHLTYILQTAPADQHKGTVAEIEREANPIGEEGNMVLIRATINKEDVPEEARRPGSSVNAKVYCGRRALGYVWFHDVITFIETHIIFRYLW
jgi:hypothetical protein